MITPEQAEALCIEAHKGQYRKPRIPTATEVAYIMSMGGLGGIPPEGYIMSKGNKILPDPIRVKEPYHTHPIAVAEMVTTDDEKVVAYLHDVVEDTDWYFYSSIGSSIPYICKSKTERYELSSNLYFALVSITKTKDVSYEQYLNYISASQLATKVKIADMFHNISSNPSDRQKAKYYKALPVLLASL